MQKLREENITKVNREQRAKSTLMADRPSYEEI